MQVSISNSTRSLDSRSVSKAHLDRYESPITGGGFENTIAAGKGYLRDSTTCAFFIL